MILRIDLTWQSCRSLLNQIMGIGIEGQAFISKSKTLIIPASKGSITLPDILHVVFPYAKHLFLRATGNELSGILLDDNVNFSVMLPTETCSAIHVFSLVFFSGLC